MIINIDRSGTVQGFKQVIQTTLKDPSIKSLFILSCDANNITPEIADPILKQITIPVFGGIFPSILYEREKLDHGTVVVGFPIPVEVITIQQLSDKHENFIAQIDSKTGGLSQVGTIFVFVDGFSSRINSLIDNIFTVFGLEYNYIGGGAGSLTMISKPCLFTKEGLLQDSGVLAFLNLQSGIGVSHGWQSVGGPFRVTESDNNIIKMLDWKPAFEVYHAAIRAHSNLQISKNHFFDIAKSYPFGITKIKAERIVRDPIMVLDDDSIVCVGEVPEGSFVDLLNGDAESLIQAAGKAKKLSWEAFDQKSKMSAVFFIDCISRVLFLEDRFTEEINAVWSKELPLFGACTIGEIANSGKDYLEFYNKTAVVAIIGTA